MRLVAFWIAAPVEGSTCPEDSAAIWTDDGPPIDGDVFIARLLGWRQRANRSTFGTGAAPIQPRPVSYTAFSRVFALWQLLQN